MARTILQLAGAPPGADVRFRVNLAVLRSQDGERSRLVFAVRTAAGMTCVLAVDPAQAPSIHILRVGPLRRAFEKSWPAPFSMPALTASRDEIGQAELACACHTHSDSDALVGSVLRRSRELSCANRTVLCCLLWVLLLLSMPQIA
jgi:hypothetical protein